VNATNYNPNATIAGVDANGNSICLYDTTLPKVYIETENQTTIKQKTEGYVNGLVTVVAGTSIKSGATIQGLESLVMEIRGRGNSTWMHPKKPYQMKLAEKAAFLDMPKDKKWIFLAEYSDKTMLRNTMALEMGYTSSLDWTPEGEFAEVYINGEYNGTYNITQKVEEKSNRVDLGDNGFLMEIDQPQRLDADDHFITTSSFPVIALKEPDLNDIIEDSGIDVANETKNKISSFVNEFESALYGSNFDDPVSGYAKYIDIESFIDWFLINEITKNVDAKNFSSIYFNVILDENNEGKIKMGPLWDFDLSFGNNNYSNSQYPEGWWVKENAWITRLMEDPAFEKQVKIKFHNHYYAKKEEMLQKIANYAEALEASVAQNDLRWAPYIGTQVWPNPNEGDIASGNSGLTGYADALNYMTNWYETRMGWLKDNLPSVEGCMDSNATNYNDAATIQTEDQYGNKLCTYSSCNEVPANGCKYSNSFAAWNPYFTSDDCVTYGGTPCNEYQILGCTDPTATNYNTEANLEDNSCEYPSGAPACVLGTIYITEAHGKGNPEDYIEIYNSGDADCSLLGFMLDDEQPFADLTFGDIVIPAGGYWLGEEDAEGSFGSGIGGGGDNLYLGDAQGNFLVVASLDGDLGATNFTADGTGCSAVPSPGTLNNECTVFVEGCTDPTAANYNSEANIEDDSCEYASCSANWQEIITNQNHSIFITGPWTDVNGNPMGEGAALGVFYEDENGALKSAGWTEFAEGTAQIAAMGDDDSTDEIDGLSAGEELTYRIWDPVTCTEYKASVTYSGGPEAYVANGITFINSVNTIPPGPAQQVLNLVKGWSIISTYMIPDEMDLGTVLAPIVEQIIIAKDYSGAAFLPEWNFNGIGDLKVGQGYQIKTSDATDLIISGAYATPEQNAINYTQGWNMIGYLRTESASCDLVLADMVDKLIIAKNSSGAAYLPEWSFNGIGHMKPGEGYQIKTTESGSLHYHSNEDAYRLAALDVTENHVSHFPKVTSTGHNMTVIVEDKAWDNLPTAGAEIAAYDASGKLIASSAYTSPVTVIPVWGDDATTSFKDGLSTAEVAKFKLWNTDHVKDFYVKSWSKGSAAYNKDAINVASSINTIAELNSARTKELVKTVNILGQEVSLNDVSFVGTIFFNIYDDGSVEKVVK
ncbi:MAG: CotH kinase family protein, partial [Flavobacteriales bacterium]|nr:CotH kinase family protein [Flavobacteriales bacterium]